MNIARFHGHRYGVYGLSNHQDSRRVDENCGPFHCGQSSSEGPIHSPHKDCMLQ
jgi:hypothetical protein